MAYQLNITGHVQGVFCRAYCKNNAVKKGIRGSASNLADGSVKAILDTVSKDQVEEFIRCLYDNPYHFNFYGKIENIKVEEYEGPISGDYNF